MPALSGTLLGAGRRRGRRPRVELWGGYAADGGAREAFVAVDDVVALTLPDAIALDATGRLLVIARPETAAALRTRAVVRVVRYQAPSDFATVPATNVASETEWRILRVRETVGETGQGLVDCTLVPRIADWALTGRMRTTAHGRPEWRYAALVTPAEALTQWVLPWVAARGQAGWSLGTVDRTDPMWLELSKLTPRQALGVILERWQLEAEVERASASSWVLHLRSRVGGDAAPVVVRPTRPDGSPGALRRAERTRDATGLGTAVAPLTNENVGPGRAAWRCTSAEPVTDWTEWVDPAGGPGPIQRDGQLVGAFVQRADGTRVEILQSERNDGTTSRLRLADASGITAGGPGVGHELEFRADAAGTLIVALEDPAAVAEWGRVEVPLDVEGDADRNLEPNGAGRTYTDPQLPPTGFSYIGDPDGPEPSSGLMRPGDKPAISRVALPVGFPTDVAPDGMGWRVWIGWGLDGMEWPITPAVDPVPGDAAVTFAIYLRADVTMHAISGDSSPGIVAQLVDADTNTLLAQQESRSGRAWLSLGLAGVALASTKRLVLRLRWTPGFLGSLSRGPEFFGVDRMPVDVAGGLVVRGSALPTVWPEHPRGCRIHQYANAHLLERRAPPETLALVVDDAADLAPDRYGDRPIVKGGLLTAEAPDAGFSATGRVLTREPDELTPGATRVTLGAAPDPALAAQIAAAAPPPPTIAELLARVRAS